MMGRAASFHISDIKSEKVCRTIDRLSYPNKIYVGKLIRKGLPFITMASGRINRSAAHQSVQLMTLLILLIICNTWTVLHRVSKCLSEARTESYQQKMLSLQSMKHTASNLSYLRLFLEIVSCFLTNKMKSPRQKTSQLQRFLFLKPLVYVMD